MLSKPAGLAVVIAAFMTAAAGGAYFALRQQPASDTLAATAPATAEAAQSPAAPEPATSPAAVPHATSTLPAASAPEATSVAPSAAPLVKRRPVSRTPATPAQRPEPPQPAALPTVNESAPAASPPDQEAAPVTAVEPPSQQARFEEITIPSDTVIGVQVDTTVSSERARVEDRVEGRVTRDVAVGGRVAVPAGTKMIGSVTLVERGGKMKDRARIAVRFHTAQLADGSRIALQTTAIMREGDSPSRETAAKVGGAAVGGAILGAILGGGKGAVIGGTAGAAGGTAVVMAGDRNAATLPAGTTATVRLMSDVTVTVER